MIDMPEVALFDTQELSLKVKNYIKSLALKVNIAEKENAVIVKRRNWQDIEISPEVERMTFDKRSDLGTNDYNSLLEQALKEKYS